MLRQAFFTECHAMVLSGKTAPISSVKTAPIDPSADAGTGQARTPNGLDAVIFAWSNFEVQDVA
jgi:hypothetical protein